LAHQFANFVAAGLEIIAPLFQVTHCPIEFQNRSNIVLATVVQACLYIIRIRTQ
jgi:hypothetical protein